MPFFDREFKPNQAVLKRYGDKFYKLTAFRTLRTSGLVLPKIERAPKGSINEVKTEDNISRAKSKVYELAVCNEWQYWLTFTLDPKKYNRSDLRKFKKDLSQWIRNQGKRLDCKIHYLLVPELHKDNKNWHMHGFINGLPESELRLFSIDEKLPDYIRDKLLKGELVYDWTSYREKFGYNDLEFVRDQERSSKYIVKYIKKGLDRTVKDVGAHLYYCSQGLDRAKEMKKGTIVGAMTPSFENDYVRIQYFPCEVDLDSLKSMIV